MSTDNRHDQSSGGYLLQLPNRWFIGRPQRFLVNEQQKAAIAAIMRRRRRGASPGGAAPGRGRANPPAGAGDRAFRPDAVEALGGRRPAGGFAAGLIANVSTSGCRYSANVLRFGLQRRPATSDVGLS
jgi:hypothetical protein